jgi:RND family efflux transporter MFP subunit
MRTRILISSAAIVVVLGGLLLVFGRGQTQIQVNTTPATSGAVAREVLATGTLEPARMVEVGAQVSGTISELPADFNSVVKAGQIIARLDPSIYQSQLEAARGQFAQAQAEASLMQTALEDAKRKLTRAEELAAQDLITQAELDTARTTMQQAAADLRGRQAAIQSARAATKQAEVDLDRTVIRSPINGIVVNRNVDVGQTIAATLQSPVLFTIADLRSMNLLAEVNEGEVGGVTRGSKVSFQIESLGRRTFYGTVAEVRLQPYAEQANAAGSSGVARAANLTAVPTTGTNGTPVPLGNTTQTTSNSSGAGSTGPGGSAGNNSNNSTTATTSNTATTASATSASGSSSTSPAAPGAVTYTAVVDVPNADGALTPGATAIVTLGGGTRQGVVRLPNNALSFRPSPAMLERTGQAYLAVRNSAAEGATGDRTRVSQVWRFENNKFVPLDVVTGLSDEKWSELISGPVQAGDQLVTNASAGR